MSKSLGKGYSQLELRVVADIAKQGINFNQLDYEEKAQPCDNVYELPEDKLRSLAVMLQNMVIWRGCRVGGKFDEYYHTAEYELYSDEWEMFHIRVRRKRDNKVILSALCNHSWSGTEYDYNALLRAIANHDELFDLMRGN